MNPERSEIEPNRGGTGRDRKDPGPGRRICVDVGQARVGVAVSDPAPILASPLTTLKRDKSRKSDLDELAELVREYEVVEIVVGLPVTLAGRHGPAADMARSYSDALDARTGDVPVRLSDERLTTVTATKVLSDRGIRGRRQRDVVDQAAAVEILQSWLDARGRSE
ncbi:putative holliday junction resolvase [Actinopolyspora lacussalsi subsp. righensis]|uniref:Putative pre-16S rRNA nuclease n=1 Tax=Actinopolyspora righensis TaxID=995060 RepID=A0A1I7CAJ9_9ACTN|nr:Holliday junction resolvase RuvX [Actinopolyspora righensis]SFT96446.1 putative holliday junction resolvase [Actinopolyspora righensis]